MNTDYNESGHLTLPKKKNLTLDCKQLFNEEKKQYAKIEEQRFRSMLDLLLKFRDWEEERLKVQLMQGSSEVPISGAETSQNIQSLVDGMEQYASQSSTV
jgi:hypothetical protein